MDHIVVTDPISVDKILKQQQREKQMIEEAKKNHFVDNETALVSTPQQTKSTRTPIAPPTKPVTRLPGLPGGWEHTAGSSQVSNYEAEKSQQVSKETDVPSDQPPNGMQTISNALQNFTRKLATITPQNISQEVTRAARPQWVFIALFSSPLNLLQNFAWRHTSRKYT